jgi:hypothetical protein
MQISNNFELDVMVHGSKARIFNHEGRVYIEGREGSEFTVKIKNNTPQRVLAVLTVDGLSVISGKEAGFDAGGYILEAWGSVSVPGWRLNNKEVASFEFTKPWDSYAAGKGKGGNLGVVGCAFYYEKYMPTFSTSASGNWPWSTNTPGSGIFTLTAIGSANSVSVKGPSDALNTSNNVTSANYAQLSDHVTNQIGTGFGEKTKHRVNEESFSQASSSPAEVLTVYYDTRDGLKRRGIDVDWAPSVSPSPFPKENVDKYCQPPVGWKD